jgi:hypothetical protein
MIEKGFVLKDRVLYPSLDWKIDCDVKDEGVGIGYDLAVKLVSGNYSYCWEECKKDCSAQDKFYRLGNENLRSFK